MKIFEFLAKKKAFLYLVSLLSMAFVFSMAQAQSELGIPEGIQISPARFDLDLESGDYYKGKVNLKNYDTKEHQVKIEVEDFYVSDDSTEARFFIPDENHSLYAYDVINWIDLPNQVTLSPGEAEDIYFDIAVPEGTPTGGYYGALFFRTSMGDGVKDSSDESKIVVSQRIGTLLVIAVKGDEPIRRSGELIEFSTDKNIYFLNPVKLKTQIKNDGNLHYKAFGKIDIFKFGKKIKTIDLNPQVIYPSKIREYLQDWRFGSWGFGYYKAKVELLSEDKKIGVREEVNFWVIPLKTTISIIILIIIIILIFKVFTSRFEIKSKKIKNEREIDNNQQEELRNKDDQNEN